MSRRVWTNRFALLSGFLVLASGLTGCDLFRGVKFTNASDSWLNVRFFVGATDIPTEGINELYRQRTLQVKPGESASYSPSRSLVHIQVETVTPTWVPSGKQYWLELLTQPPVHIIAGGREEKIEFKSFSGEVAIIPERELQAGRFEYRSTSEPPASEDEGSAVDGTSARTSQAN